MSKSPVEKLNEIKELDLIRKKQESNESIDQSDLKPEVKSEDSFSKNAAGKALKHKNPIRVDEN
ncbi:MAG: hypothetical protein IE931_03535 [Sphingobacteriales bacterium]|nr:hypothetical protein [Sphingobacteriales bacterium]